MPLPPAGSRPLVQKAGWNEGLHPRGYHGKWIAKLDGLRHGEHTTIGGKRVEKHLTRRNGEVRTTYVVHHGGYRTTHRTASGAVEAVRTGQEPTPRTRRGLSINRPGALNHPSDFRGLVTGPHGRAHAHLSKAGMAHEPTGTKPLWGVPGLQLPAYIQHVWHDLPPGPERYRMAVGLVENWADGHDGKGHKVSAETQAKAQAAIAEWEKDRAEAHAYVHKATDHAGCMVALYPDAKTTAALPGDEPRGDMHLTLAYLGDASKVDGDKLANVVSGWAAATPPLAGEIGGSATFTGGESPVAVATVDSPRLDEHRARLVSALRDAGLPVQEDHGFVPHITMSYGKTAGEHELPLQLLLRFDQVHAVMAGDRTGHPFGGAVTKGWTETLHPRGWHGRWVRALNGPPLAQRRGDRFAGPAVTDHKIGLGEWTRTAHSASQAIRAGKVGSTEEFHRVRYPDGKLGPYSRERTALHSRIIKSLLQGHQAHFGTAEAVFMAGGPASGKSTLAESGHLNLPKDHVMINPDMIKEMLPEYPALNRAGIPGAASLVHEESSHIAALATNIALGQRMNVVIDTTGNAEPLKFAKKIYNAQSRGHKVTVHYATVPTDLAVERNAARSRTVPVGFLRESHQNVSQRYHGEIQHMPGVGVFVHDLSGRKPKLVASKGHAASHVTVLDKIRHDRFIAKGAVSAYA